MSWDVDMSTVVFKRVRPGDYLCFRKSDGLRIAEIERTEDGEWLILFWEPGESYADGCQPYDADTWATYGQCRRHAAKWHEVLKSPLYR